jgi:hypothetical protein
MIRTLRALFLSRLLREKLLLLAFIGLGTLWWLSAFATRASAFAGEQRRTTSALAEQQQWLDNRGNIEVAAQQAASRLEAGRTFNSTRLVTEVRNLANEAGIRNTNTNPQPSVTNGEFSVHTLNFTVSRVDWDALKKFYTALQGRAPYLGVDQFALNAARNNTHTLAMRISSVEIAR